MNAFGQSALSGCPAENQEWGDDQKYSEEQLSDQNSTADLAKTHGRASWLQISIERQGPIPQPLHKLIILPHPQTPVLSVTLLSPSMTTYGRCSCNIAGEMITSLNALLSPQIAK